MKRALRVGVAAIGLLSLLGCTPLPGHAVTLMLRSASSHVARVRIGPFKAGNADVPEAEMLAEQLLAPGGTASLALPAGRYNIEAVTLPDEQGRASSYFTLQAGQDLTLTLNEQIQLFRVNRPGVTDDESRLVLSWE